MFLAERDGIDEVSYTSSYNCLAVRDVILCIFNITTFGAYPLRQFLGKITLHGE